jgi:hypothetical protein
MGTVGPDSSYVTATATVSEKWPSWVRDEHKKVSFNVRIAVCLATAFSWFYLSALCLLQSTSPTADQVEF